LVRIEFFPCDSALWNKLVLIEHQCNLDVPTDVPTDFTTPVSLFHVPVVAAGLELVAVLAQHVRFDDGRVVLQQAQRTAQSHAVVDQRLGDLHAHVRRDAPACLGAMRAVQSEPTYQEAGKNICWQEYFFESRGRR
jgi:hypothetical protein